jgi:hypothetical protein
MNISAAWTDSHLDGTIFEMSVRTIEVRLITPFALAGSVSL